MSIRIPPALLPALLLAQLCLSTPATAGDCWVNTRENATTGAGDATGAKRYAALRERLLELESVQRADPAINALADVRYRTHRYIDKSLHPGAPLAAESRVTLHRKQAWKGNCDLQPFAERIHVAALIVQANNLLTFTAPNGELDVDGSSGFLFEPARTGQIGGVPVYEERVLVLTAGGLAPFVDVTVGEYLDYWRRLLLKERKDAAAGASDVAQDKEWLAYIKQVEKSDPKEAAELRAAMEQARAQAGGGTVGDELEALERLRASLTPAQRAQPVLLGGEGEEKFRFAYATRPGNGARKVVKANPALWSALRSDNEVRVLTLEVFVNDEERGGAARAWLQQVDLAPYRALLGKG